VKMPRRRSLAASVRVALTSGLATTGWLLLGSTSAHAAEDTAPVAGAVTVVEAGGTIASVTDALAPIADTLAPATGAVDEVVATTPVAGEIVPEGTVSAVTGTALDVIRDPGSIVDDPVGTVEIVTTPVTGTLDEALSTTPVVGGLVPEGTVSTVTGTGLDMIRDPGSIVDDPVRTVETVTTPVTQVLAPVTDALAPVTEVVAPISGAVDEVLDATPVVGGITPPVSPAPELTPAAPALGQPDIEVPAAPTPAPSSPAQVPGTAQTPAAVQRTEGTPSVQDHPVDDRTRIAASTAADRTFSREPAATARAATQTTVTGVAPATLLPRFPWVVSTAGTGTSWDWAHAVATPAGATPGTAGSASSHGGAPAPSGSSTSTGGGPGSPLGSADPMGWPGMPAGISYLELFPRLSAGKADSFFGAAGDLPTAPAFDPGSTPD